VPLVAGAAAGILIGMYSDGSALRQLSRDECLHLLASVPVGRIVYTQRALPAVELVNFALDHGEIVIRTDRGGKLAAAARGAVVAFEADSLDPAHQAGWSVTVIGRAHEVTDPEEIAGLRQIGLRSWAPGTREHFIRIAPGILNGRYLHASDNHRPAALLG
jgi:nitroimidazol reductase NimA-like FMN-containing flavoprotein (pyridoxamine 5'-phosphate oxidase superfamily)